MRNAKSADRADIRPDEQLGIERLLVQVLEGAADRSLHVVSAKQLADKLRLRVTVEQAVVQRRPAIDALGVGNVDIVEIDIRLGITVSRDSIGDPAQAKPRAVWFVLGAADTPGGPATRALLHGVHKVDLLPGVVV